MSIVPASRLSSSDLSLLGNNLRSDDRRRASSRRRPAYRVVAAVNRSLARVGERVGRLGTGPCVTVAAHP